MKTTAISGFLLVLLVTLTPHVSAQSFPEPRCDSSPEAVERDETSLRDTIREALVYLLTESDDGTNGGRGAAKLNRDVDRIVSRIETEYAGPADFVPIPPADELPTRRTDAGVGDDNGVPARITDWLGVNPVTCNQFRMRIPVETSQTIADLATAKGLGSAGFEDSVVTGLPPWDWKPPQPEPPDPLCPANTGPYFSGCVDSRLRFGTSDYPNRTIANFSNDGQMSNCTGTLVGPRHVITAAHCVYQGNNIWHDFHVIPGRDGANKPYGSTFMSDTQGLNNGFRWYWVPAPLVGSYPDWYSGLDIAILIIPQRLGDQTGWMGLWALPEGSLSTAWTRNRGYPAQPGSPVGFHCSQIEGALYGDINICNVGDYTNYDGDGWARMAGHSCDNTSGHSGSPIFAWVFDPQLQTSAPGVTAIISHHDAFVNNFDCANNPRPYKATRITPEYANQYLFMRSWKP